ncbi:hypothetical protein EYZ11_004084 [Aspergillus tanneri]|uniref:Uncharacterized protein n=1 Tax=Aspergillus tanneri TaxID=1220188 RepID=A0A4S3JLV1_9EURO|nr:hypothetical protein EYZ11_004084 [Aspergillus tanneri]
MSKGLAENHATIGQNKRMDSLMAMALDRPMIISNNNCDIQLRIDGNILTKPSTTTGHITKITRESEYYTNRFFRY